MKVSFLQALNEARTNRQPVCSVTTVATGDRVLVTPQMARDHPLGVDIESRYRSGKSGTVTQDGVEFFVQVYLPSPRLVVVGAVHISQALVPMAQLCGLEVLVVDPRTAFATPERFADVLLMAEWPADVLVDLKLDAFTALVAVTHDLKIDDTPIAEALNAGSFYVGALGSRKTHAKRLDRLREAGMDDITLSRIQAPIGLDIGAATPAEIAVAIMAQIIEAMRKEPTP